MLLISIFTPAYNRAEFLERLYTSLKNQTYKSFEWIIVDDGSSDNTNEIIEKFIAEDVLTIKFYQQYNSGKHIAINKGVELAVGELFYIVDSDDYLPENSLDKIKEKYNIVKNNPNIAGVCGRKGYSETKIIGNANFEEDLYCNALELRYKYKFEGDMAEVIKTEVIKEFPFPKISDERFLTEGYLWFRVAQKYQFLFFPDIVYIAEYQDGGLSASIFKIRKNSPEGSLLFYKELQGMPISFVQKVRANINYWRFARYSKRSFLKKFKDVNFIYSVFGIPLSLIFLMKDK